MLRGRLKWFYKMHLNYKQKKLKEKTMNKKILKKIFSIIIALVLILQCLQISVFAAENGKTYTFKTSSGETIEYHLDKYKMPYQIIEGEKFYVALALPQFEVKNTDIINKLNKEIFSTDGNNSTPTNYFDLYAKDPANNSIAYTATASGLDSGFFNTKVFKYCLSHSALVIKTSSHSPLLSNKKVHIMYYYYDTATDRWYLCTFMDADCTGVGGFRFLHFPDLYHYGRAEITAASTLKSCHIEIFSTPYATSVAGSIR